MQVWEIAGRKNSAKLGKSTAKADKSEQINQIDSIALMNCNRIGLVVGERKRIFEKKRGGTGNNFEWFQSNPKLNSFNEIEDVKCESAAKFNAR